MNSLIEAKITVDEKNVNPSQADEKSPSVPRFTGFHSSFPVSSTGQACCRVPVGAIHELPLQKDFACLHIAPALLIIKNLTGPSDFNNPIIC